MKKKKGMEKEEEREAKELLEGDRERGIWKKWERMKCEAPLKRFGHELSQTKEDRRRKLLKEVTKKERL